MTCIFDSYCLVETEGKNKDFEIIQIKLIIKRLSYEERQQSSQTATETKTDARKILDEKKEEHGVTLCGGLRVWVLSFSCALYAFVCKHCCCVTMFFLNLTI